VVGARAGDRRGRDRFYGLREFRTGENPRLIHWKSSARLGRPLVREMEDEDTRQVWILLDNVPADPGLEGAHERFELAVSFAATLARELVGDGYQVGLMLAASEFRPVPLRGGPTHLHYILRELALVGAAKGADFDDLAAEAAKSVTTGMTVYAVLVDDFGTKAATLHRALGHAGGLNVVEVGSPSFERMFFL
jgi:uncharacterized protein (DUF58 family)